jgi:hypothetical protein
MAMTDYDLNEAIIVFIGYDLLKAPVPDRVRLAYQLGQDKADAILPRVRAIIAEMDEVPVNWSTMDLNAATDHVIATIRERHPELSDRALLALDWLYSFANR